LCKNAALLRSAQCRCKEGEKTPDMEEDAHA
jgi:hypothetical protein